MIIGLTGNYGMGKSFVLHVFKELGAIVLDSDEIVDFLLQEKKVIVEVKKILGHSVVREDGTLDKAEIAKKIFNNSMLRNKLEALLHPLVFDKVQNCLTKVRGRGLLVIV
jgi:dephospho-CoA kinase